MEKRFLAILCIMAVLAAGVFYFTNRILSNETNGIVSYKAHDTVSAMTSDLTSVGAIETTGVMTEVASGEAMDRQPYLNDPSKKDAEDYLTKIDYLAKFNKMKSNDEAKALAPIPVFKEEALLFDTDGLFYLGRDACYYENQNSRQNFTGSILLAYPTEALRERKDGSVYICYATDTGYRFYLYFNGYNNMSTPDGFPVVLKELLSFGSFQGLKVGDPIKEVEDIDPVTLLYEKQFMNVWNLVPVAAKTLEREGYPCTSIHYLRDGILKIEYSMREDRELAVSAMEYNSEYKLKGATGRAVDYRISDIDLPPKK